MIQKITKFFKNVFNSLKELFADRNKLIKLLKTFFYFVGNFAVVLSGLIYLLFTDLRFSNTAPWLLGASILAFGGGICGFFSANFKEKKVVMLILKGASLALSVGLIAFMCVSKVNAPFTEINAEIIDEAHTIVNTALVFVYIAVAFLALDLASTIVFPERDE